MSRRIGYPGCHQGVSPESVFYEVGSGASMTADLWQRIVSDRTVPAYRFGTRRAVSPTETLRRIRPLLRPAGITRLADVTGLDWIGIPVYQAIRPNSRTLSASQ